MKCDDDRGREKGRSQAVTRESDEGKAPPRAKKKKFHQLRLGVQEIGESVGLRQVQSRTFTKGDPESIFSTFIRGIFLHITNHVTI